MEIVTMKMLYGMWPMKHPNLFTQATATEILHGKAILHCLPVGSLILQSCRARFLGPYISRSAINSFSRTNFMDCMIKAKSCSSWL